MDQLRNSIRAILVGATLAGVALIAFTSRRSTSSNSVDPMSVAVYRAYTMEEMPNRIPMLRSLAAPVPAILHEPGEIVFGDQLLPTS